MDFTQTTLQRGLVGLMFLFVTAAIHADDKPAGDKKPVALKIGEAAPGFEGRSDAGKKWKSRDVVGRKFLVVYFYPADFTTGCTRQALVWRDNFNKLAKAGVEVVGVSGDSVRNHELFKSAWKLNFTLLADEDAGIAKTFGVPFRRGGRVRPRGPDRKPLTDGAGNPLLLERKFTFSRWTFIIGKGGKILYRNMHVVPARDSEQVLEFIKSLKGPKNQAKQPKK